MDIQTAKYVSYGSTPPDEMNCIAIVLTDGTKMAVPVALDNTDYIEIMRQVEAGTLTIAEAE